MANTPSKFHVTFKSGLHSPIDVYAESPTEAAKIANAEYRRNAGFVETVILTPLEAVIDQVTLS